MNYRSNFCAADVSAGDMILLSPFPDRPLKLIYKNYILKDDNHLVLSLGDETFDLTLELHYELVPEERGGGNL